MRPLFWQRRFRQVVPVVLGVSIVGGLATGLASAVRKARNSAQASATT